MKLSRKVLAAFSVVAMLATSMVLTSCKEEDDEEGAFSGVTSNKVDFDNSYIFVSTTDSTDIKHAKSADDTKTGYTVHENTSYYYRAFSQTTTKHYDSVCKITLTPNAADSRDGVAGYVFGLDSNADNTYNFGVAAVSYNREGTGKLDAYVSYYKKALVKENNFQEATNFLDKDGTVISPTENTNGAVEIDKSSGWVTLSGISKGTNGKVTVVIRSTANADGSYKVEFFKGDALVDNKISSTAKSIKDVTVAASDITSVAADQKKVQRKLAYYANIDAKKRLIAEYGYYQTNGEAIVFED